MTDQTREVRIGETAYRIARFKGLKAVLAGALVSRVMREVPDLQEKTFAFRKHFRENNTIKITPAMAKMSRFAPLELTTADFEAVGGDIEFPEDPGPGAIFIHVFPDLFELAREQLQRFFALLVIPNRDLEEADDADTIDEALTKLGKKVIREADIDELVELFVTGVEVFRDQMSGKKERLGELHIPWLDRTLGLKTESPTDQEQESNGHGQISPTPTEEPPSPPQSSVPPSSSDVPDGDSAEETSSTEPLGASSS